MSKTLLRLILLLLTVNVVAAGEVRFEGKPPANRGMVQRWVERDGLAADSVTTLLVADGYLDAVLRTNGDSTVVFAGERTLIESVVWTNDSISEFGQSLPFTQDNVERLVDRRLQRERDVGHYYSSATVEKVVRRGNEVTIEARLNPGPLMTMAGSMYLGLKRTNPELIARYLPTDSGEIINEDRLIEAERRAAEIPFVGFQPPINIRPRPGYTDANLEFSFVEKRQVRLSGGGGYVPGSSSSLVWNLDLSFQNLFGGGRRIRLISERREDNRQILDVAYRQPVFLVGTGDAGLRAATRDYRDQFYEFSLGADYRTRLSRSFATNIELAWRSVEPSGAEPSYNVFTSGLTIENSSLDDPANPSSGAQLSWTISFGYRRYATDSLAATPQHTSFNETRTIVAADWYQRVKSNLIGHLHLEYRGLETGESLPPVSELFLIGGPPAIRGYRNEQFAAVRTAFGTLEPRVRFRSGYLFAFYDGAYLNNRVSGPQDEVVTDEFYRYSYGLGAAVVDRGRSVKMSIGWNPDIPFDQPRLSLEFSSDI